MRDKHYPGTLDLESGRLLIGYARVSTDDQDLRISTTSCTRIFAEKITGTHAKRPKLG